ncbi:MAG: type 1 glutamine amidotransferase domain-containing protein [Candidatus Korobacteraceae bacterium]
MADEKTLDGMRVAIVVTTNFEQVELTEPRKALEAAGASCTIVAPQQHLTGMNHDEKADVFEAGAMLDQASPDEFDAVLLPGGALNADVLRVNRSAQEFVRKMDRDGKPMAVICHAPWLLVSAGMVKGRRLTAYYTIQDDIRNAGGEYEDAEVIVDGNLVTSRQPSDIPAFNRETISLFAQSRRKQPRAA